MSTITGTATDYLDLLAQLRAFLTTDSALVSAGQNWTELATNSTPYDYVEPSNTSITNRIDFETYLKAPGLSGSENIYINLQAYHNTPSDYYNWRIKGAIGYISGVSGGFQGQPGSSPDAFMALWNQPITFWFVANGQRVIVIAKISSIYVAIYFGKILAYATPGQYPYPVYIGGSSLANNRRFSDTGRSHSAFPIPANAQYLYYLDGTWQPFSNASESGAFDSQRATWPYQYDYYNVLTPTWMREGIDGSYPVIPVIMTMQNPAINVFGELDGVGFVPGFGNAAEDTITIGSDTWLVVQNVFRTGQLDYFAVKLA